MDDVNRPLFFCLHVKFLKLCINLFGFKLNYYTFAIVLKGTFSHGTENVLSFFTYSKDMRNFFGTIVPCAASSRRSESERTDTEQIHFRHIDRLHNVSSIEEILTSYISSHGRL